MKSYALHRPIGPFTWPSEHKDKVIELVNFDHMKFVPEIGRSAFGYIEWADGVPTEALRRYELMVPPTEDAKLEQIGRILARFESRERWDGFEKAWNKARNDYGYSERDIEAAWLRHSENGGQ